MLCLGPNNNLARSYLLFQHHALQSLKKALQPAATKISVRWDLPPGLEAVLVGSGPQVIFEGQRSLIYAQIRGQLQSSGASEGSVVLQYNFQDQTFTETMKFPLQAQESDRLPVHRLAAQALLQDLEGAGEKGEEKQRLALQTSLSSGVVCSQTAYVGVNTELGQPIQGPLRHWDVPLACYGAGMVNYDGCGTSARVPYAQRSAPMPMMHLQSYTDNSARDLRAEASLQPMQKKSLGGKVLAFAQRLKKAGASGDRILHRLGPPQLRAGALGEEEEPTPEKKESPLLRLVFLQNADGSWTPDSNLASLLGLSEAEIRSKTPKQVAPNVWATVLAILWLHSNAAEQRGEWELLEAKALNWLQARAGSRLVDCVKTGNAVLGSSVSPQTLGL